LRRDEEKRQADREQARQLVEEYEQKGIALHRGRGK
jgi:hypothetical protein